MQPRHRPRRGTPWEIETKAAPIFASKVLLFFPRLGSDSAPAMALVEHHNLPVFDMGLLVLPLLLSARLCATVSYGSHGACTVTYSCNIPFPRFTRKLTRVMWTRQVSFTAPVQMKDTFTLLQINLISTDRLQSIEDQGRGYAKSAANRHVK